MARSADHQARVVATRWNPAVTALAECEATSAAIRPALARFLRHTPDEAGDYSYSEQRQLSVAADGAPVVGALLDEIGTFAERDRPDPEPSTATKAERDPGDLQDATLSYRRRSLRITATQVASDPGEPTTITRATRDAGDPFDASMSRRAAGLRGQVADSSGSGGDPAAGHDASDSASSRRRPFPLALFTEAARDRDRDPEEPDSDSSDDLVTGVVAF